MNGLVVQEKKFRSTKGVLACTFKYSLDQQEDGLDYRQNFEMFDTKNTTLQKRRVFEQHIDGVFLLNQNGVVSKFSEHSEMKTDFLQNVGIADTVFTLDSNLRLTNVRVPATSAMTMLRPSINMIIRAF